MFDTILVVCMGNICRSPIGERYLQILYPNKKIASAGIGTIRSGLEGKPADSVAVQVAEEHGLDLTQHQSQQLTSELCVQYDLILVMEKRHLSVLSEIAPEARGKAMLFGQWIGQKDIPDPYRQSKEAFDYAYQLIVKAAEAWRAKL